MVRAIAAELVEAYSLCPRKAFLLLNGEPVAKPPAYCAILFLP